EAARRAEGGALLVDAGPDQQLRARRAARDEDPQQPAARVGGAGQALPVGDDGGALPRLVAEHAVAAALAALGQGGNGHQAARRDRASSPARVSSRYWA